MGTLTMPDGGKVQTPEAFDNLTPEEQQQAIPSIFAEYQKQAAPTQDTQAASPQVGLMRPDSQPAPKTFQRDPRNSMIDAANASVMSELPASLLEGAGAGIRTIQNAIPGKNSNLGNAVVDTAEKGADWFRKQGQQMYQRPTDLPKSASGALLSGDIKGGLRSLGFQTAEGAGMAIPAVAAAVGTGGASVPIALGLTGLSQAGELEHKHGAGSGLTKADLADVAAQAVLPRVFRGYGPLAEARRAMLGNVAGQATDRANGTDAGMTSGDRADSLLDAAMTGATTGAGAKYAVAPTVRAISRQADALKDYRTGQKDGFGDSLQRVMDSRTAEGEWDKAHQAETQRVMQSGDITPTEAMNVARDNLLKGGMAEPKTLSPADRKVGASLDWYDNIQKARQNRLNMSKPGDAPLAKAVLDQSKADALEYVQKLGKAGPDYGGVNNDTAGMMKQLVTHAATHNHDSLVGGDGTFLVTPEDKVRNLAIPEAEKRVFLRHLDTIRMAAHNGLEKAQSTPLGTVGRTIGKAAPRLLATVAGMEMGGIPGAIVGQTVGEGAGALGEAYGNRVASWFGAGGMPSLKGMKSKSDYAQRRGFTPGAPLQAIQGATSDAAMRAIQRARAYADLKDQQAKQAAASKVKRTGFEVGPDEQWQSKQAYTPNPAFDPDTAKQNALAVGAGRPTQEPVYPEQPAGMSPSLALASYMARKVGARAYEGDDGKVRVRAPAGSRPIVSVSPEIDGRLAPQAPQARKASRRGGKNVAYTTTLAADDPYGPIRDQGRYDDAKKAADDIYDELRTDPSVIPEDQPWLQAIRQTKHKDDKTRLLDEWLKRTGYRSEFLASRAAMLDSIGSKNPKTRLSDDEMQRLISRLSYRQK